MLSEVYKKNGGWEMAINYKINAFYSTLDRYGIDHEKTKHNFSSMKVLIDLALETSSSYVNAMYTDDYHPHLDYKTNMSILLKWKDMLRSIKERYGENELNILQLFCINELAYSYKKQFGAELPYIAKEHLTFYSQVNYIKCLLDIMDNRMVEFSDSFKRLLEQISPIQPDDNVDILRYKVVNEISELLFHSGFSDWASNLLITYWNYLVAEGHENNELAEKVMTTIGYNAWQMNDIEGQIWATSLVGVLVDNPTLMEYCQEYHDINELVLQLILYSRIQSDIDIFKSKKSLIIAKNLVEKNMVLDNGIPITSKTKRFLYNELGVSSHQSDEKIIYFTRALDNAESWDYTTRLNLAVEYNNIGMLEKSDSLAQEVLEYAKAQYIEPTWKTTLYNILTRNAIKKRNFNNAYSYSRERLSSQISDYLKMSQSLTSQGRSRYWDQNYSKTLEEASSVDLTIGINGSVSYDAALFQKSILMRQKLSIQNNILLSNDQDLKDAFEKYNHEIRSSSDSSLIAESNCMYLYSLHPEYVRSFNIPTWKEVKQMLGKNELAIEYSIANDLITGDRYYVAVLLRNNSDFPIIERLCKCEDLISAVTGQIDERGFPISLYEDKVLLYNLLWAPIEKYLKGVNTVYYSPYECLNNVNMEIATKKCSEKNVGEEYLLYRVTSTSELTKDKTNFIRNAVIFGDIDYNTKLTIIDNPTYSSSINNDYSKMRGSMGGSWIYLPNTKREIESIQKRLQDNSISTTIYKAETGTEDMFKSLSSSAPDILHLATHGFYYTPEQASQYQYFSSTNSIPDNVGIRSGLILSGANHAWNGENLPQDEDGILTAEEICGMNLSGTKILTLSACQTALGDIVSDGVYGLQRSFKIAGVSSIVMSLWQVDDEATYLMMDKFYTELAKGKEKHEAFRIAQTFIRVWAEKKVKELKADIDGLPYEVQQKRKNQYGGRLYPEYYFGAFVMLD